MSLELFDRWLAAHDKEVLDKAERVSDSLHRVPLHFCSNSTIAVAVAAVRGEGEQDA